MVSKFKWIALVITLSVLTPLGFSQTVNLNDTLPAAPSGGTNVRWQKDTTGHVSAYLPTLPESQIQNLLNDLSTTLAVANAALPANGASSSGSGQANKVLFPGLIGAASPSTNSQLALPAGAHGFACDEAVATGSPTAGIDYIRCDATSHKMVYSYNGGPEAAFGSGGTVTPAGSSGDLQSNNGAGGLGSVTQATFEKVANRTGNGSKYCTVTGTLTPGDIITADSSGNCIDSGVLLTALTAALTSPVWATGSLASASESVSYTQSLSATGGTAPYTFSLVTGTFPTGISLAGSTISGTPGTGTSASSPYSLTLRVTDNTAHTVDKTFSLVVNGAAVATPAYSPDGGVALANDAAVTVSDSTTGSSIVYCTDTTNACTPTTAYSAPVTVGATGLTNYLRSQATKAGLTNSAIKSASYAFTVATPTSTPSLPYTGTAGSLALATTTTSAVLHFNTTGSPTCSDTTYSAPISVAATTTYYWIGCKNNYTNSAVSSGTYSVGASTYALVQTAPVATDANTSPSATTTFTSATSVGHLLVAKVACYGNSCGSAGDTTVADNLSNTWAFADYDASSSGARVFIFYALVSTAGTPAVTVTNINGNAFYNMEVSEWSGNSATPLDVTSAQPGGFSANTDWASQPVTTTGANELFAGACTTDALAASVSYNNGFTKDTETLSGQPLYSGNKTGAAQTTTFDITGSQSITGACVLVAFK